MFYALSRLSPYILLYRSRLTLGLGCLVVTTAISLISPWILKFVIDDLADVGTIVTTVDLMFYALLLVGIALIGGCSRFFSGELSLVFHGILNTTYVMTFSRICSTYIKVTSKFIERET